jgi:hypothetical protein
MSRPRAPWWMYLCALAFLGQFAHVAVSTLYDAKLIGLTRRIPHSIVYEFQSDRLIITGVKPNSAPDRAGVRVGDWLLAINGEPIGSLRELTRVVGNLDISHACRFDIERDGRRLQILVPVLGRSFEWSEGMVAAAALLGSQFIILILGIVIGFSRPNDAVARLGALMLATMGVLYFVAGTGMISDLRHLPTILGMLLWIPRSAASVVGVVVFVFCACFPRRLLESTRVMAVALVPGVVDGFWNLLSAVDLFYRLPYLETTLSLWPSQIHFPVQSAYALAGLAALGANYGRLQDRNDQRRLRVVWAGMAAAVVPAVPVPISDLLPIHASVRAFFVSPAYNILRSVLLIITPSSIAYAILHHRLFDIRLMIRRGIQYALARRILVSVVPGLMAILVLDLMLHGNQPLVSILIARGWIYAALGGMALFARTQRHAWLDALDRRFFREHYDARRILRDIASEVRDSGNFEQIVQRLTSRIQSALHSDFVTVLTRQDGEIAFQVRPASQLDQPISSLPAGSKLLALLRVLGKPLQISLDATDWLTQQLPQEEVLLLRIARIELIIPVVCGAAGPEALLLLGPKHSEEPYSGEDLDLLTTIAANLAMLFEQRTPVPRPMSAAAGDDREPGVASIGERGNKSQLRTDTRSVQGRISYRRRWDG